ncbi:hypothetical protein [Azospirillum doebereinerae]|nr:hypothetical protein [Azospirillum doebereinerae]MCG5238735.1 hypothetical protein [Azospirillum doebereinerae]
MVLRNMANGLTYAGEASVPRFQAKGRAPLTPAEMIAKLPALLWPD